MLSKLMSIFETANHKFLERDISLIRTNVNERGLCDALAQHLAKQYVIQNLKITMSI